MPALFRDEKVRNSAIQVAVLATVVAVLGSLALTTHQNLQNQGITSGFGFLERTTGWDIPFSLLDYSIRDPYWRILLIGFLNTLFIGFVALVLATVFGVVFGIARISANPLLRFLGTLYVEVFRNVPLILQAFFWYAIATHFPPPRRALELGQMVYLSSRGVYVPTLNVSAASFGLFTVVSVACVVLTLWWRKRLRDRGETAVAWKFFSAAFAAIVVAFGAMILFGRESGSPLIEVPVLQGLRFIGGIRVIPEFMALTLAIVVFGSAYIAEIVRGGFNAVSRGQLECARALGLRPWMVMFNVHIPLAMRAIVPPLGNMYVWLMKATTLGIAIGFSDLFMIVSTSINQSGQTIELLGLMMAGFFVINYSISSLMNLLNRSIAIKGYETDSRSTGTEL
ncbi:MAG: amino acid ABC transporter permease [Gammaproteobacteria bacterium]